MNEALPLDPEAARLAASLSFADSEGGPLIAMSESAISSWNGVLDSAGNFIYGTSPSDYDRACDCDAFALIDVGSTKALTLESPDNGAFVAQPDGALIVRWIGADDEATLLTAAFAAPPELFEEHTDELPHDGGRMVMFDSTTSWRNLDPSRTSSIDLPAGRYALSLMIDWATKVLGADGLSHDVMVQVIRLRRR